MSLDSRDVSNM